MTSARLPHLLTLADGRRGTLLDCEIGGHTGHFAISRVELFGRKVWGCDGCIEAKGAQR